MKSKAMNKLLATLEDLKVKAQGLISNTEATAEQLTENGNEISLIQAKIKTQEIIDEGKKFDEQGDVIKDKVVVNDPIFAQPNEHKPIFNSFSEQLRAIVSSTGVGTTIDPRLLAVQNAASGANESQPNEGGYLVQTDFAKEILKNVWAESTLAGRARKIPIGDGFDSVKMNGFDEISRADGSRMGGVRSYWVAEAGALTASQPTFRQILLDPKKIAVLWYATKELMRDNTAASSILMDAFSGEIAFGVDSAVFEGNGSGKPRGFMKSPALITQAKLAGQKADTVVHENISALWARLLASSRATAIWLVNQEVEPFLSDMAMSIGTGGQLSPYAMEYMMKGTIKGRPVIASEDAKKVGDLGDIVLVDMKQYLLAQKGGVETASSIHVRFLNDETAFRILFAVDGQTSRASAITPKNATSGQTLGSFITLAERT